MLFATQNALAVVLYSQREKEHPDVIAGQYCAEKYVFLQNSCKKLKLL